MPNVVSDRSSISSWRGEMPFFSEFSPRLPGGTYGCWAFGPAPQWPYLYFLLRDEGCFSAFPVVWCWEPSQTSPLFHFAPSGAGERPSIAQLLEKHPSPLSPRFSFFIPLILFTSASCVEKRVGIIGNECTLGPKSYPISMRPNLRLAGPGIYGQTKLARSNTGSDTRVQYALSDQGPTGAGSRSHMTHHLGRARLTLTSPPRRPGKTPLSDKALPVGCHMETIIWTVLGHRLRRLCSFPQEISYTNSLLASFER